MIIVESVWCNFFPPLGKGDLLNAWTCTFHCLSVQKLNTDTFCSSCAPKITSVVPVYVMLENCLHVCVWVHTFQCTLVSEGRGV